MLDKDFGQLWFPGFRDLPQPAPPVQTSPFLTNDAGLLRILREDLPRIARAMVPVVLTGEEGTGKEIFACELHRLSPRSSRPFFPYNSAALSVEQIWSELFGFEKGVFTGAVTQHAGLFEELRGGTLFLDEIADMPLRVQAALLRVAESGEFHRLGGKKILRTDVWLLAATNRNLAEMAARRDFRPDLWRRLSVFVIEIPPLRQRKGDLELLVPRLLGQFAKRFERPVPKLAGVARKILWEYDFPGNVRELENILTRALILSPNGTIEPEHLGLPPGAQAPASVPPMDKEAAEPAPDEGAPSPEERRRWILEFVRTHGGICRADYLRRFGLRKNSFWRDVGALVSEGVLRREARGRKTHYRLP